METFPSRRLTLLLGAFLLVLFFVQGMVFIRANAQTYDEAVHLSGGYSYLTRRDYRLMPEHPPLLKELAALPVLLVHRLPFTPDPQLWELSQDKLWPQWPIGYQFLYGSAVPAEQILTTARLPNLVLGTFLAALVGWWAYRLWGTRAALLGLALAALEPSLLAHSCLVTNDLGVSFFFFLTVYLLWEYRRAPSPGLLLAVGTALGLALAAKFSAILLVGVLGLLGLAHLVRGDVLPLPRLRPHTRPEGVAARLKAVVVVGLVLLGVAGLVILAVYQFTGLRTWWTGLLLTLFHSGGGHEAFLLGEHSREGWWYYFLVALLVKLPVGTLLLLAAALLCWRAGQPLGWIDALFLLLPVGVLLGAAMHAKINIGIRHVLPVYPFLFVLAARLGTLAFRRAWTAPVLLGVPLLLTASSSLRIGPHQLAYFNELAGGPAEGYRYLSDSNLDWGQDLTTLRDYLEREGVPMLYLSYFGTAPPHAYGIRYQHVPPPHPILPPPEDVLPLDAPRQLLAVSVTNLQGVYGSAKDQFRWLDGRAPVAKVGYSIYVYDVTDDADAHRHLAALYRRAGLPRLAEAEEQKAARQAPPSGAVLEP